MRTFAKDVRGDAVIDIQNVCVCMVLKIQRYDVKQGPKRIAIVFIEILLRKLELAIFDNISLVFFRRKCFQKVLIKPAFPTFV